MQTRYFEIVSYFCIGSMRYLIPVGSVGEVGGLFVDVCAVVSTGTERKIQVTAELNVQCSKEAGVTLW